MAKRTLISQATAARYKGCSRQNIHELIKRGRLKTYTRNGNATPLVDKNEVLNLEEVKRGRPLNHPKFARGAKVLITNKRLTDAPATVIQPLGGRVKVLIEGTNKTTSVKIEDVKLNKKAV